MGFLSIHDLEYRWGESLILPRLSFQISRGQFACLLGPSGSGKTTLLRLIAGLEKPDNGRIVLDGKTLGTLPPDERQIGMVFQEAALFPNKNVAENIAFGLPKNADKNRVQELLSHIGLEHKADAFPHELSGGQQHRVALARALAPSPKLLLLDEAFSHLDPERRMRLREETKTLAAREGVTCLMVTHDAEEAMQTGDVIVLMDEAGRLRQQGTPHDVFHHPVDRYAASALGDINLLQARSDGQVVCSILGEVKTQSNAKGDVTLGVRPQGIMLDDEKRGAQATIERVTCTGPEDLLLLKLDDAQQVKARLPHTHHWREGDRVGVSIREDYSVVFEASH